MGVPIPLPHPVVADPGPITYTQVSASTEHGKASLVNSLGYAFTLKVDKRHPGTMWRCTIRSKSLTCRATVLDRDGEFIRGSQPHICNAQPDRQTVLEVRRDVNHI